MAITDDVFRYSTVKTGHLVLLPAAFLPSNTKDRVSNGGAIRPITAGQHCWSAPVNLPHGAKMTALALWYQLEAGDTAFVQFIRQKLSDGTQVIIGSEGLPVTNGVHRPANLPITDASLQTVSNAAYGYFVNVCFSENGAGTASVFRGARITYHCADAGD